MIVRKRFLLALAISFALHLVVITGPGWYLPDLSELLRHHDEGALDARLLPPATPAPRPAPARKRPPRREAAPQPKPDPAPQPEEKVSRDDTTPPPPEAPPPDDAVPDGTDGRPASITAQREGITLPNFVRIHYRVAWGDNGFTVGKAFQELRHNGEAYVMRSSAETTGLAALFRPASLVTTSGGYIVAGSLQPDQLLVERRGATEAAQFDWTAGTVTLPSGQSITLPAHTQDMLSMFGQLALLPIDGSSVSIPVLTSKVVEEHRFDVLGEETVTTGWGERRALHLRNVQANGVERTDVWLGLNEGRLPIKIRIVDRKGDIFVQTGERIEFEEGEAH